MNIIPGTYLNTIPQHSITLKYQLRTYSAFCQILNFDLQLDPEVKVRSKIQLHQKKQHIKLPITAQNGIMQIAVAIIQQDEMWFSVQKLAFLAAILDFLKFQKDEHHPQDIPKYHTTTFHTPKVSSKDLQCNLANFDL